MTSSARKDGFTDDFPTDPALGPLAERFCAQAVLDAFRQKLSGDDAASAGRWQDARMIEALYHPGRYFRAAYAFLPNASVPDRRVWPEGDVVYIHTPARQPISRRGALLRVGGTDVELYCFPNDRRLRGLRKFSDRDSAVTIWQGWLDALGDKEQIAPQTLQRHLLRYVPEQKWVARLRAEPAGTRSGKVHKRRITVRASSPENSAALHARYTALRQYYKEAKPLFHTAKVIGHDAELGLLAVKWAHGDDLASTLRTRGADDVCRDVVAVVRSFHESQAPDLPDMKTSDLRRSVNEAVTDLSATCSELRGPLSEIGLRLGDRLDNIAAVEPVTLHNDLHWKQFLFDGSGEADETGSPGGSPGRITLLDLERMSRGDPLIDVANLVTQVRMLGHRPEFEVDQAAAARWGDVLFERWQSESGRIDPHRFRCYSACSMLNLARGMMRHLRIGWRELAKTCVELADAELTAGDREAETQ